MDFQDDREPNANTGGTWDPSLWQDASGAQADGFPSPDAGLHDAPRAVVFVCHGPSCGERGGRELSERLEALIGASPARRSVRICVTTCLDSCATGPNVLVSDEDAMRTGVIRGEACSLEGQLKERLARET